MMFTLQRASFLYVYTTCCEQVSSTRNWPVSQVRLMRNTSCQEHTNRHTHTIHTTGKQQIFLQKKQGIKQKKMLIMTDDNSSLVLSQGCPSPNPSHPTLVVSQQQQQQQDLVLPPKVMPIFLDWYNESFLVPTSWVRSLIDVVLQGDDVDLMILLTHMSTNLNMSWDLIQRRFNTPITNIQTTPTNSFLDHLLHLAALRTDGDDSAGIITEHLLRYGAKIESQNETGFTALAIAVCDSKNESVVKVLLRSGADFENFKWRPNDSEPYMSMLHIASTKQGTSSVVKLLLEKGANIDIESEDGGTPLAWAVGFGNYLLASLLLKGGADCQHWRDRMSGRSMMHLAIASALFGSRLGEGMSIVKLLLEQECVGEIINATNDRDQTPLQYAAFIEDDNGCKTEVIQLLLVNGANVHARDNMGRTVLHVLKKDQPDSVAVLKLLLDAGADIHAQNLGGQTVLHQAAREDDCFQTFPLLLVHALKIDDKTFVDVRDSRGMTVLHYIPIFSQRDGNTLPFHKSIITKLLDMSQDVNSANKSGRTPLHTAVKARNEWYVRALLSSGAADALNVQDERGQSPLHYAVSNYDQDMVKILLDKGADINAQGELRRTALHLAAMLNQSTMARLLMERGADSTITDLVGMNPLDAALANRANRVATLLS